MLGVFAACLIMMVMVMGEFELDVGYYGLSKKMLAATPGKEKKKKIKILRSTESTCSVRSKYHDSSTMPPGGDVNSTEIRMVVFFIGPDVLADTRTTLSTLCRL